MAPSLNSSEILIGPPSSLISSPPLKDLEINNRPPRERGGGSSELLHILFSLLQATHAKAFRDFISFSEFITKDPRYLKLNKIWHSTLANETKVYIFKTLIEPILLYGAETWTLTTRQQKRLDGVYTNMLRRVQNIHWLEHATLEHIYGDIPPLSQKVIKRRLSFAGHCHRATEEMIHHVLLWRPRGQVRYRGLTYPDTIARDACMEKEDLPVAMADREVWRQVVDSIPAPRAAR